MMFLSDVSFLKDTKKPPWISWVCCFSKVIRMRCEATVTLDLPEFVG